MALIPDYSGLEPEWLADCHKWNANITATNHRQPALSNPPTYLRLFNDGYDTLDDLKADLDKATTNAGWLTVKYHAKENYTKLLCSRGAQRATTATASTPRKRRAQSTVGVLARKPITQATSRATGRVIDFVGDGPSDVAVDFVAEHT
jgi:hypothetical protein